MSEAIPHEPSAHTLTSIMGAAGRSLLEGGWQFLLLTTLLLVSLSFYHYLLFHTLVELFAIMVGVLLCVIAWQTSRFSANPFLLYLAGGYFWIAMLDLVHTLVYKGMGVLPITEANPATQLWIAARYSEALLLLSAPLLLRATTLPKRGIFIAFGAVAMTLLALVMSGRFPDCFVEGRGLTPFKIVSEYLIVLLLIGAMSHLWLRRRRLKESTLGLMLLAMTMTILAELAFTSYISVYGFTNLLGHLFKLISMWLVFVAIIRTMLHQPYLELSARNQGTAAEQSALRATLEKMEGRLSQMDSEAAKRERRLEQLQQLGGVGWWEWSIEEQRLECSDTARALLGRDADHGITSLEALAKQLPEEQREGFDHAVRQALWDQVPLSIEHPFTSPDGTPYRLHHEGRVSYDELGKPMRLMVVMRKVGGDPPEG